MSGGQDDFAVSQDEARELWLKRQALPRLKALNAAIIEELKTATGAARDSALRYQEQILDAIGETEN